MYVPSSAAFGSCEEECGLVMMAEIIRGGGGASVDSSSFVGLSCKYTLANLECLEINIKHRAQSFLYLSVQAKQDAFLIESIYTCLQAIHFQVSVIGLQTTPYCKTEVSINTMAMVQFMLDAF
jgi:hypothetical protein